MRIGRLGMTISLLMVSVGCAVQPDRCDRVPHQELTPGKGSAQQQSQERKVKLELDDAINKRCPRSGKPVVADSLTTYRGVTVGFCNQHCRDDFAANVEERPADREFFDDILAKRE